MASFLDLRGGGGAASGPLETDLCGVVRSRAELLHRSQAAGANITQFLIASRQIIRNRVKSFTAKEKIFSNR
jgi:hypothetical protein